MNTSTNIVYLIALPLFSSALLMLLGRKADKWGHIFATLISASAFFVGVTEFFAMRSRPEEARAVTQKLFTWISVGDFQVDASLLLDQLSIAFVLLITAGKRYIDLMTQRGATLLDTETVLGDPELGYTGQPDKLWLIENKEKDGFGIIVTDWKTNKPKNFQ